MSKLKFELKQHSPIIHFQWDQKDAGIRATELKPKLDKYLINFAFNNDFNQYKEFLIGYADDKVEKDFEGKKAFDYKVKIYYDREEQRGEHIDRRNPLYFGNMGNSEKTKFINTNNSIFVEFFTFNATLLSSIDTHFRQFLAVTNFGTRQNKGFGSFYLKGEEASIDQYFSELYYFKITSTDDKEIYDCISTFYKKLKSGINLRQYDSARDSCTGYYFKSYLYTHLNNVLKITWEKRWLKEKFFGLTPDGGVKTFARALLGLPGSYLFKQTNEPCNTVRTEQITINRDCEIQIKNKPAPDCESIERFKSPILFKVIKNQNETNIYVIPGEIDQRMLGAQFEFSTNSKSDILSTPSNKLINNKLFIKDFISAYVKGLIGYSFTSGRSKVTVHQVQSSNR